MSVVDAQLSLPSSNENLFVRSLSSHIPLLRRLLACVFELNLVVVVV